jgi:hypothetical protein
MVKKTQNLEAFKQTLIRDINLGAEYDNLSKTTINLYVRQLTTFYKFANKTAQLSQDEFVNAIREPQKYDDPEFQKVFKLQNSNVIDLLRKKYISKESLVLTLNAMCKLVKNRYRETFQYYNAVRKVLSKQNKDEKLNNELSKDEMTRYISYDELMAIPSSIKAELVKAYGSVFISKADLTKLTKKARTDYLRTVLDYVTLYLNIHYPLRLVWPSVFLSKVDGGNYLEGNQLFLNDFKNVRLMGAQTIMLDRDAISLIKQYLDFLSNTLDETPTKLLYRLFNGNVGPYDYTTETQGRFSKVLGAIFKRHNGQSLSMNMIRHIVESNVIQSPDYAGLTNREKNDIHARLLHSSQAANVSYNKISNRASKELETPPAENDYEFSNEDATELDDTVPVRTSSTRSKRRERIFHGEFKPDGAERGMEIDIFQS